MDSDPDADPDPSIFFIDLQDANKKLILFKLKSFSADYFLIRIRIRNTAMNIWKDSPSQFCIYGNSYVLPRSVDCQIQNTAWNGLCLEIHLIFVSKMNSTVGTNLNF